MVEYEVEEILDKRGHGEQAQYLIKWAGYPKDQATWEPTTGLSNVRKLVKKFNKKKRSEQNQKQNEIKPIKDSRIMNPATRLRSVKDYKDNEVSKKLKNPEKLPSSSYEIACSLSSSGPRSSKEKYKPNLESSKIILLPVNPSKPSEATCNSNAKSTIQIPIVYQSIQPEVKKTPDLCLQLEKSKSPHLFVSQIPKKIDLQVKNSEPQPRKLDSNKFELDNAVKILDHFETKNAFLVKVLVANRDKKHDKEKVVMMPFAVVEKSKPELLATYCRKLIHSLKI